MIDGQFGIYIGDKVKIKSTGDEYYVDYISKSSDGFISEYTFAGWTTKSKDPDFSQYRCKTINEIDRIKK